MAVDQFIISLCLILFCGKLFGSLFKCLALPAVVGEILAGLLLGPTLLNFVTPNPTLAVLAELGVILLLFSIGCETSIKRLYQAGGRAVSVAALGIIVPAIVIGFSSAYYLTDSPFIALYLGCALTATSIGISLRVLNQAKQAQTPVGNIILGAAVIDDIAGVILLSVLFNFASHGELDVASTFILIAKVLLFLILTPPLARALMYLARALKPVADSSGYEVIITMILICFFAWLAHLFGAPALLGGFAVGLALSRQFISPLNRYLVNPFAFTHKMELSTAALVDVFAPIFFVYVGISLDLSQLDYSVGGILLLLWLSLLAILSKLLAGWLAGGQWQTKAVVGSAMVPRGEVGLVFAELGLQMNIIDSKLFTELVVIIAITTLVGPLLLKWSLKKHADLLDVP
ncbi:cation:proton antiporter [Shewanella sp. D64]|uniref:cation:proton antiporter n=1 Tax=unclassified Shewanella TaxID=196818 RepID=UPI0022BA4F11|nr:MULTISPECIES: cation:proton antiporter [unclassified Shewanella]MEC4727933.1 cation:proton antiporter [Shewanella sp. D64]MEC4740095.1 cation:proton antiporter [Shewanella sp. E94]WBJ95864.1 cation:proton antiporter [Shewanella sp. MTB7]